MKAKTIVAIMMMILGSLATVLPALASGVPPPMWVEACDSSGNPQDTFNPGEDVYITGVGFPYSEYTIYVVEDTTWVEFLPVPSPVTAPVLAKTDGSGAFPLLCVWSAPLTPGSYDIVADFTQLLPPPTKESWCDLVDDMNVETAGFFAIPEYPLGTILGLSMCLAALAVFKSKSLRIHL